MQPPTQAQEMSTNNTIKRKQEESPKMIIDAPINYEHTHKMDPQNNKILPVQNDRFKDPQGKPLVRYECKISHVNNGRQQLWDTSKQHVCRS